MQTADLCRRRLGGRQRYGPFSEQIWRSRCGQKNVLRKRENMHGIGVSEELLCIAKIDAALECLASLFWREFGRVFFVYLLQINYF